MITLKTAAGMYQYRVTRGNVVVHPTDYWVVQGDPKSTASKMETFS